MSSYFESIIEHGGGIVTCGESLGVFIAPPECATQCPPGWVFVDVTRTNPTDLAEWVAHARLGRSTWPESDTGRPLRKTLGRTVDAEKSKLATAMLAEKLKVASGGKAISFSLDGQVRRDPKGGTLFVPYQSLSGKSLESAVALMAAQITAAAKQLNAKHVSGEDDSIKCVVEGGAQPLVYCRVEFRE